MIKLNKIDFNNNGVEVDYIREYNCKSSGCGDICRCSSIVETRVEDINISLITDRVYYNIFDNSLSSKRSSIIDSLLLDTNTYIDLYTIDRAFRSRKLYLPNSWTVNISKGYYGEEIESVVVKPNIARDLEDILEKALSLHLRERIEYLLILEYGYILPELANKNYKIITVSKSDIIFGSNIHLKKVIKKDLNHYSDNRYHGIRGIVIKKGEKYKLIDGYHRCFASIRDEVEVILSF